MFINSDEAVNWITGRGLLAMAQMENATWPYQQFYHVPKHISYMMPAAIKIGAALQVSPAEKNVISCAVAIHDRVQDFEPAGVMSFDGTRVLQRKRKRGHNEAVSADSLGDHMRKANELFGYTFKQEEIELGKMAVEWTFPDFVPAEGTFNHPKLRGHYRQYGEIPSVCAAVVWADLANVGQDPANAAEFAVREYLELAMGIWQELAEAKCQADFLPERRIQLRDHALAFFASQEKFITGRQRFMEEEIEMLPDSSKRDLVRALFPAWEQCRAYAKGQYDRFSKLDVFELLWTLGFHPVPAN